MAKETKMEKINGSAGIIFCPNCKREEFDLPKSDAGDPLVKCICGKLLGPIFSLRAKADGLTHTSVNAELKQP